MSTFSFAACHLAVYYVLNTITYGSDCEELHSHSITLNSKSPELVAHLISDQMKQNGFIFVNNTQLGQDISINLTTNTIHGLDSLSQMVSNTSEYYSALTAATNFTYKLGNVAGRKEIAKGINKVSGAPKQTLVTGHSEASYLEYAPTYLIFACPGPPDLSKGGSTIVYSICKIVEKLKESVIGRKLLDEVAKYGVIYIRNDPSIHNNEYKQIWDSVSYPMWQNRFSGLNKSEIQEMLSENEQNVTWIQQKDGTETLHTEWKMPGFRLHPITNKITWFNQLYAMNGRYFDEHNVAEMDSVVLRDRPLHTLIGNGRELTDEEYQLLHDIHDEIAVLIPWDDSGDILAIDNFAYQHGRAPYDSYRNCVINWGQAVTGGQYIYNPMHFNDNYIDAIQRDLSVIYKLLDKFKWYDTMYQYVAYRLDQGKVLVPSNSEEFSIMDGDKIPIIYKNILNQREDVNVIIHVNNPDIAAVAMSSHSFLPIDQSYYMLVPVTHYYNQQDTITNITNVLGFESRLLLIKNGGMIILGTKIEEAFTRLFYAIKAAQAQTLALSIHDSVDDIIFPSEEIQRITTDQALNFNADGYGHLEFVAWKRRHNLDLERNMYVQNKEVVQFPEDQYKLRKDVAAAYHALDKLGWIESIYQHITATLPNNDNVMLINAYGLEFGEVTIENLMEVQMDGTVLYEGNSVRKGFINPSGLALHAAVHEARADAKVVIHCHNDALSAISVHKDGLSLDSINIGYRELIGEISYHDFDSLSLAINKTVLGNLLQNGNNVILLRNHGILTIGETVKDAFNRLYYTILASQQQLKTMLNRNKAGQESDEIRVCDDENSKLKNNGLYSYYNAWARFSL